MKERSQEGAGRRRGVRTRRRDRVETRDERAAEAPAFCRWDDLDEFGAHAGRRETDCYMRQDWRELARLREAQLARHPEEPEVRLALAEAYLQCGELPRALELAGECHKANPGSPEVEGLVLEALYALGKTERDFDWAGSVPSVQHLDQGLVEKILARVEQSPEGVELAVLYYGLSCEAFLPFELEALARVLQGDPRLVVENADLAVWHRRVRVRSRPCERS